MQHDPSALETLGFTIINVRPSLRERGGKAHEGANNEGIEMHDGKAVGSFEVLEQIELDGADGRRWKK